MNLRRHDVLEGLPGGIRDGDDEWVDSGGFVRKDLVNRDWSICVDDQAFPGSIDIVGVVDVVCDWLII